MARYALQIMMSAVPGEDAALNAWLDDHHIPEGLEIDGFLGCTRYELASGDAPDPGNARRYMHLYEIETDDLAAVQRAVASGATIRTPRTPALDMTSLTMTYYRLRD